MATRISLLGTGIMGAAMAERLLDKGYELDVWDRTPAHATELAKRGATPHAEAADAVRDARIVISMLATGEATRDVMFERGALAALPLAATWVQMGTIGIEATERLLAEVEAARPDVAFVDAPVLGTRDPARNGQLTVLASGPVHVQASLQPIFDALGQRVVWLGAAGMGMRMKLAMNTWLAFEIEAAAEVDAIAHRLGIPYDDVLAVVQGGPLASGAALSRLGKMEAADDTPSFPLEWALKDLELVTAAAGPETSPVAGAIAERWRHLVQQGYGRLDASAARLGLEQA